MPPALNQRLRSLTDQFRSRCWHTRRQRILTVGATTGLLIVGWHLRPQAPPPQAPLAPRAVTALGRLTPVGGIVSLSIAAGNSGGSETVKRWLVPEGSMVRRGQLLGLLSSWDQLEQSRLQAEAQVLLDRAKLQQVAAGARSGVRAQAVADLKAEQVVVPYLEISQNKSVQLFQEGAISEEELGKARSALAQGQARIQALRGGVQDALTVRPVDIQVARSQLRVSEAGLGQAIKQLANAEIRSPVNGRLLRIYSWPGMKETDQGLAQLGQVGNMQVWAQVYQTDVLRVRPGQTAMIWAESGGFNGKLQARVREITGEVSNRDLFSINANNNVNARVVLVKLDLSPEDSRRLANLTGLNVNVRFAP
jgi:HlyD family secretion protein